MKKLLKNLAMFVLVAGGVCAVAYGVVYVIDFRGSHDISIEDRKQLSNSHDVESFKRFGGV